MKEFLSLTKIGNLKVGRVMNGQPVALDNILVTYATKEGAENFQVWKGFHENGEEEVRVTLPFNSNDLNFEVAYTGFFIIDGVDYLGKAENIGDFIHLFPLYPENFDKPVYIWKQLTEELLDKELKSVMQKTGLLRVMVEGVSHFGEVFHYKTHSPNSIRAIRDQLEISRLIAKDGKIAGRKMVMRPVRRDNGNGEGFSFVSIAYTEEELARLTEDAPINVDALEAAYVESRETAYEEAIPLPENIDIKYVSETGQEVVIMGEENKKQEVEEALGELGLTKREMKFIVEEVQDRLPPVVAGKWMNAYKQKNDGKGAIQALRKAMEDGVTVADLLREIG